MSQRLNLADDLSRSAASDPDKAALLFGEERVSFRELDGRADSISAGLHKIGVRTGDRVAFAVRNSPSFVALYYGSLRAGAVAVPLHTRLRAAELRAPLGAVSPRAIVADESVAGEVMAAGPHSAPVFVIGAHPTARPFGDILLDDSPPEVATTPNDLAVIALTSGTTGSPKPVGLSHGKLSASLDQLIRVPASRVEPADVVLGVLPLSHIYGLNVVLGLSIRQGATVVLEERFDPARTLRSVVAHGVTVIPAVPPMFRAWLDLANPSAFDLSGVRFAVSGGSGLEPEVFANFRERFGVEIWEGYGLTEASSAVSTTRMAEQRPGSIGKVMEGIELRLVDESGADVLLGDPGEVWLRGPNVFESYWHDEEATAAAFSGDWFMTGDVAYQDEDGYLWLVDPEADVIEVSGFKVYPKEVEEALASHPAVTEVAVVGEPDTKQGQRVKAFVVLQEGVSVGTGDLTVHCTRMLARFKVPAEIDFVTELPKLESGLIVRRVLRRRGP